MNTIDKFVNKTYNNARTKYQALKGEQLKPPTNDTLAKNLKSFFSSNKTIQKNFRFDVEFFWFGNLKIDTISPWHVLKVSFPTANNFRMESIKIGPYHYGVPIMDTTGYDFDITFEEDDKGTILNFIYDLQGLVINEVQADKLFDNGNYNPQTSNRLSEIIINTYDDVGNIARKVKFRNCFFLRASQADFDYEGSQSVKYTITFHSDLMEQGLQ